MANISGLYTALSGMNAQRRVLDVTAHNVANQATEGFHRQRVELKPVGIASVAAVFAGPDARVGGVEVNGVIRIVDQLAESRYLHESAAKGGTETLRANLDQLERAFPEPSDDGLAAQLDDFWGAWSDLASRPGDSSTRTQLLERSQTLVDSLHRASSDLDQLTVASQNEIVGLAVEANDLATRIAQLNKAIIGSSNTANDLQDQRDLLIRELSTLTGAVPRPMDNGQVDVYIGGRAIVSGPYTQPLDGSGGVLRWAGDGSAVVAPPSRAAALAQTINDVVPRYRSLLDGVASQLVSAVNAVHTTGYDQVGATGWNFFDPTATSAATISLSTDVIGQPGRIAAGAPVFPGPTAPGPLDGENARAMTAIAAGATGPDSIYRSLVSGLGVEVRSAHRRDSIQDQVTASAEADVASVGGVSLDEEMANLVAAQRAYEASARVLTTVDSLLEVLLRTGLAGR
jgi:flagellar hook-associated protein 1 FlgK